MRLAFHFISGNPLTIADLIRAAGGEGSSHLPTHRIFKQNGGFQVQASVDKLSTALTAIMMRTTLAITLLCGAVLISGVLGDSECSEKLVSKYEKNVDEFGAKMTACLAEDAAEDCCAQVQDLFAKDGSLENCLCDSDFFSMVLETIPASGVDGDAIVDMWEKCDVPFVGNEVCGASEQAEEPKVKAQLLILKKKLIAKKLVKKALLAKALAPRPAAAVVEEEEDDDVAATAPIIPKAGKKGPKVVAVAPSKKAVPAVPAPAPPVATPAPPAPAPAPPVPAPAPPVGPKVTAPLVQQG